MGAHKSAGFTIIETTLFLGISGALIITMIAGTTASLNIQRYRDSVETFKSMVQQQYADLTSVHNSRNNNLSCGVGASPVNDAVNNVDRGQSDCMLMGKYMSVNDNKISIYQVLGYGSPVIGANDIEALRDAYSMNVSKADEVDRSTLEWGARIAWPERLNGTNRPGSTTPRKLGILILRSPDSGRVYTFTANDGDVPDEASLGPVALRKMVESGDRLPGQGSQVICIESQGMFTDNDRAIYLNSFAAGSSAVETRTNEYMQSISADTKC